MKRLWKPFVFIVALVGIVWADCYERDVLLDDPCSYWRMNSPTCTGDEREGNQSDYAGHGGCIDKLAASATPVVRGTPGIAGTSGDAASLFSSGSFVWDSGGSFNDCSGDPGGKAHPCASGTPHDFTLEAWVKPASTADGIIVTKAAAANNASAGSWSYSLMKTSGGKFRCHMWDNQAGADYADVTSAASYNPGDWSHVLCTVTGSSFAMQLWVDSVADNTTTTNIGGEPCGEGGIFQIGVYGANFTPTPGPTPPAANIPIYTDGFIDEVATYNVVLSSTRIASHHAKGLTASACGTNWPFNVKLEDRNWRSPLGISLAAIRAEVNLELLTNPAVCGALYERRKAWG